MQELIIEQTYLFDFEQVELFLTESTSSELMN